MLEVSPIIKPTRPEILSRQMIEKINTGIWPVRSWLPPTRQLADDFDVSRKTINSTLEILERCGLVQRVERQGCFVKATSEPAKEEKAEKTQIGILCQGGVQKELLPPPVDATSLWGTSIQLGMQEGMAQTGKLLTFIPRYSFDEDPIAALLERIDNIKDNLAGLICFPKLFNRQTGQKLLNALEQREIPYVTINRYSDLLHHNFVSADYISGARLLGRCLAKMGLRRVVLLGTHYLERSHCELELTGGLFQGFAIEDAPTDGIVAIQCDSWRQEDGYKQINCFLKEHQAPQAVLAMGDYQAIGAMQALQERGLHVPDDVAVVGTTGLHQAKEAAPALTTLSQPMEKIGQHALAMLLEMQRGGMTHMTGRIVPGTFDIRQSLVIPQKIKEDLKEASQTWEFVSH